MRTEEHIRAMHDRLDGINKSISIQGSQVERGEKSMNREQELEQALLSALLGLEIILRNGQYLNIGLRKQGLPELDLAMFALKAERARALTTGRKP